MHQRNHRRETGSILVLIIFIAALIFIPAIIMICQVGPYFNATGKAQNAVEAAGLLAANDLSRIVFNDSEFGYVSLSNHPALGIATRAPDGEPLPVTGINTLIGTVRQNAIIAAALNNKTMGNLVDKDLGALSKTTQVLNDKLKGSLDDSTAEGRSFDMDGKAVKTAEDVKSFLSQNLPSTLKLESVNISLGWLQDGSETGIKVPLPASMALVHGTEVNSGQYEAFTNVPVGGRPFSFAGVGAQSHLVSNSKFREADGQHISSIVRIQCTLSPISDPKQTVLLTACSQPCSQQDMGERGAMTVRFAGRPVAGVESWRDFLSVDNFQDNKVITFDIVGGDYPFDKKAKMQPTTEGMSSSTAKLYAEHLYYWLRNGRVRPRLDSVLAMVNEPFQGGTNEVYTYRFSDDGKINRNVVDGRGFTRSVTADGQVAAFADTRVKSGDYAMIIFRDNVKRLGTQGGKHAGQPLAGYPLGSQSSWTNQDLLSSGFSKRNANSERLALDIEIGGTGEPKIRTDMSAMHKRTMSRQML